jgi:hypothetical protein
LAGTQVTGGVGGTTFGTLSSIGSDLSVSVSFNIANELLEAAHDEQLAADELGSLFDQGFVQAAEQAAVNELATKRSGLDFLALVVNILQRILVAISVQLLAASVRAQQQSRLVRTVSLIGLAIFFVFVESLTNRHV